MKIKALTPLYGIFGNPVRHSLSPLIHNTLFKEAGINARYLAFEPSSIQEAIKAMRTFKMPGASITIPYKIEALDFIDAIDPLAQKIGSINTLQNSDGIIKGYNTDGWGALLALKNKNINVDNVSILIIGNGGSARAIAFTLLEKKALIYLAGRNKEKIKILAKNLKKNQPKSFVDTILLENLSSDFMTKIDIIINTTPIGMEPNIDKTPLPSTLIQAHHKVFDIIYAPQKTLLLRQSLEKKCLTIPGLDMLVYQALKQFEIWTGQKMNPKSVYKALANL